jgi:hypothetical protein
LSLLSIAAYAQEKDTRKSGELTDPVAILKKVDAAAKAVKAVKYDVVVTATGAAKERVGKLTATIIAAGVTPTGPEKFVVEAKAAMPGSKETRKLSGGNDGDKFYVVDHAAKKAYEDFEPAVMGSAARIIMGGMMLEYLHPTPFSDEINGKSQKLTGSKEIGGVECYEIHVVYAAEQAPEATWYFSKKDFLPRCRIDAYTFPDGQKGTVEKTVTKLVVDPKLDEDTFKLKLPKGYTKTDDFAP